jgi:CheY-like chemotaxis protein
MAGADVHLVRGLISVQKEINLATLGHDLRSPLSGIMGLIALIQQGVKDRPEVSDHLALLHDHTQYMLNLVNGLVVGAKVGEGTGKAACTRISPWELVVAVARACTSGRGHLPVRVHAVTALPVTISTDPLLLRQVLTNLIGNALTFTREGGVRVQLGCSGETLDIVITDTGPGMSSDALAEIFRPNPALVRPEGEGTGHGLGMWIAQRLLTLLEGSVSLRSIPGRGTAILVTIPTGPLAGVAWNDQAALDRTELSPRSGLPILAAGDLVGRHILVADDMPANILFAATVLKHSGASVTVARDGGEALAKVRQATASGWPYELIILDHHMPVHSGCEVARQLRREGVHAPLLCWTSDIDVITNLDPVFTRRLEKPIAPQLLLQAAIEALRLNRA